MHRKGVDKEVLAALELLTNDKETEYFEYVYFSRNSTPLVHLDKNQKALNQMIKSLSLYSAGESNSDCKIENLEY